MKTPMRERNREIKELTEEIDEHMKNDYENKISSIR